MDETDNNELVLNKISLTVPCCDGGSLTIYYETKAVEPLQEAFKAITNNLGFKTTFEPLQRKGGGGT